MRPSTFRATGTERRQSERYNKSASVKACAALGAQRERACADRELRRKGCLLGTYAQPSSSIILHTDNHIGRIAAFQVLVDPSPSPSTSAWRQQCWRGPERQVSLHAAMPTLCKECSNDVGSAK